MHSKQYPHSNQIRGTGNFDKCVDCDLKSNLWLCLECGSVGCGRKYHDGTGGNNHGIDHFNSSGHNVSIKLGTVAVDCNPSCYCYKCNDEV